MANTNLGLPQISITFSSKSATAIARSARGIVAMILNDENVTDADGVQKFTILDTTDIPATGIADSNVDLIKKALLGTPSKIHAYLIPPATHEEEQVKTVTNDVEVESDVVVTDTVTGATDTVTSTVTVTETSTVTETVTVKATVNQSNALKALANVRYSYICHPTGTLQDQQDIASWVQSQRKNREKTCKAVVAHYAADDYGVINFTTTGIKVENSAYAEALELADGDESAVEVPRYLTYTTAQYTARIAGILAGISLDRSATYYELPEVVSVDEYDDIDAHINNGEFCLFDEQDDNGVKIARGINSLTTFTGDAGQDFRFIKNVEGMDLIKDDVRDTFRNDYVGKVANTYNNKMLFVSAILAYFHGLEGNVLDPNSDNTVDIDYNANYDYAKSRGASVLTMSRQQILEYPTGTQVFLTGNIRLLNAMEDLTLEFALG